MQLCLLHLNHCISSYLKNIISQLYLTMFEVVYRHTSGPSTTPNVVPQTNNRQVIVMWFGLQPPGSGALSPEFLVLCTSQTIERQSLYQTFISIRNRVQLLEVQPPIALVLGTSSTCFNNTGPNLYVITTSLFVVIIFILIYSISQLISSPYFLFSNFYFLTPQLSAPINY